MALVLWLGSVLAVSWIVWQLFLGKRKRGPGGKVLLSRIAPTHAHENIAINIRSGRLWVRDQHGDEAVFDPEDILGWDVRYEQAPDIRGESWPHRVFLDLTTVTGEKAVWRIGFDRHDEVVPHSRNLQECREWSQQLAAVYNPTVDAAATLPAFPVRQAPAQPGPVEASSGLGRAAGTP